MGVAMKIPRTVCATVTDEEHAEVHRRAYGAGVSVNKLVKRALLRDLGPLGEEGKAERDYGAIEVEFSSGPLAKFALLAFPKMEDCESAGCEKCRGFLAALAPDIILSTDAFVYVGSGGAP